MSPKQQTLPDLPYDYSDLEPVISGEIMELHHKKHHNAYVTNLNAAMEKYLDAEEKGDITKMIQLQSAIKFNGGGHINHSIFWSNLAPQSQGGGGEPEGVLADAINDTWGSFEAFKEQFSAKTAAIQGSGWGWLCYSPTQKRIATCTRQNQDPSSDGGCIPLLGIDVWEHAYYLQYKNVRPEYVKAIWGVINWANVAERYTAAIEA